MRRALVRGHLEESQRPLIRSEQLELFDPFAKNADTFVALRQSRLK